MKPLLYLFIFLFGLPLVAQDSTNVRVEAPRIVSKLEFGKTVKINDVELKFVKVVSDSRCPKNVQCVLAGQVEVLVSVKAKGKQPEQKRLILKPIGGMRNVIGNLFASEGLNIRGINVTPYPVYGLEKNYEDYKISLEVTD